MVNEDRVKELFQMAVYDQNESSADKKTAEYYQKDYIWKEVLVSFFSGTAAFGLLLLLWGLAKGEELVVNSSLDELASSLTAAVLVYIAFMAVYMLATVIAAYIRFAKSRSRLKKYRIHLRKLNKMYEREDKLKM